MGLLFRQKITAGTCIGAFLAAFGLYFLSVTARFTMGYGDFLVLQGAFFWAGHVIIIGWLSPKFNIDYAKEVRTDGGFRSRYWNTVYGSRCR